MMRARGPTKRSARRDPGDFGKATTDTANITAPARQFQGVGNARHATQPAPCWRPPEGTGALCYLAALWRPRARSAVP